ncbi:hypothetical protein ACFP2T_19255 [Plantactinospora solaniradicis]|uniref:Uncharacterized protein n=1 Tax=Plantactinospora solaniradicis TaxID=1723736 RepID=A0ABW1K909_9ACTN
MTISSRNLLIAGGAGLAGVTLGASPAAADASPLAWETYRADR